MKHTFHVFHERRLIFDNFEVFESGRSDEKKVESQNEVEKVENAQDWLKKLLQIARQTITKEEWEKTRQEGGLLDQSRHLSVGAKKALQNMTGDRSEPLKDGRKVKVIETNENGYEFAIQISGSKDSPEIWYVSEPDLNLHRPSESLFLESWIVLWKRNQNGTVDKQTQITFPVTVDTGIKNKRGSRVDYPPLFINFYGHLSLNPKGVERATKDAIQHRESELADKSKVRDFDIPRDEFVGYVCLYDNNPDDPVMRDLGDDARYFSQLLIDAGYNIKRDEKEPFISFDDRSTLSPCQELKDRLGQMYKNGIRIFYINAIAHGTATGIALGKQELQPRDLREIFDTFRDCRFVVNTIACYGGQFEKSLQDYKDHSNISDRVRLFLQSQITAPNMTGIKIGRGDSPYRFRSYRSTALKEYSVYYHVFLAHYLLQKNRDGSQKYTYGMAHWLADQHVKTILGAANAQSWVSSPDGGINTAMRRRDEEKNRPA